MINDPHSLLGIAHVEDEDIHKGRHVEGGEGAQGQHKGGLGQCQWVRWFAKLARKERILNTEAAQENVESISEEVAGLGGEGTRCWWNEHYIVHQTLHCHVQTVGVGQHLDYSFYLDYTLPGGNLGEDQGDCFEESERVEALDHRSSTPG